MGIRSVMRPDAVWGDMGMDPYAIPQEEKPIPSNTPDMAGLPMNADMLRTGGNPDMLRVGVNPNTPVSQYQGIGNMMAGWSNKMAHPEMPAALANLGKLVYTMGGVNDPKLNDSNKQIIDMATRRSQADANRKANVVLTDLAASMRGAGRPTSMGDGTTGTRMGNLEAERRQKEWLTKLSNPQGGIF